jgi:hypothetical protein
LLVTAIEAAGNAAREWRCCQSCPLPECKLKALRACGEPLDQRASRGFPKGQFPPVGRRLSLRVNNTERLAMRPKIQALARVRTADELKSARITQIFGLAMAAVFAAMLLLNAISY